MRGYTHESAVIARANQLQKQDEDKSENLQAKIRFLQGKNSKMKEKKILLLEKVQELDKQVEELKKEKGAFASAFPFLDAHYKATQENQEKKSRKPPIPF
jgi:predicted nuclease with TOPRIM domain